MKNQRGFIIEAIIYGALAAGALFTIYTAWTAFTGKYVAQGVAKGVAEQKIETDRVVAEFASYKAQEQAMIDALKLQWSEAIQQENLRDAEAQRKLTQRFGPIRERVRMLPPAVASVRIPDAAVGVLDAAIVAANATAAPTGPAAAPVETSATAAAATTVGDLTAWGVMVIEEHAKAREQIRGWIGFYAGLRKQRSNQ